MLSAARAALLPPGRKLRHNDRQARPVAEGQVDQGRGSRTALGLAAPYAASMGAMASFQVGAALAKTLFPAIGAQGAVTLRLVLGSLMLIALVRPWRSWPRGVPILPLLALGVCMAGSMQMFYLAIQTLPIGVAMALQFLGPLSIAILGSRRPIDLLWAALAAAGVWVLVMSGADVAALDPVGVAWSLGAATLWAGYILIGRSVTNQLGNSTAAITLAISAILILPVGVIHAGAGLLNPNLLPVALLVGLFSAAIPFSLEFFAMPRMPARTFAVMMSLEPAFGVLSGLIILGEHLSRERLCGIALVIMASAGAVWSSKPKAGPADPTDAPPG